MDLIIDANVLFAALVKESMTERLLFSNQVKLFAPEYLFAEFENHQEEILEKTKRTPEDFFRVLSSLRTRIILVPLEELTSFVEEAEAITPDPDDMAYFALALLLQCPIWSNDKKLKSQETVRVYTTKEILSTVTEL